ncbi:hypothetical protein ACFCV3_41570 [Kribbella sp. NPDC056345]|uniref:hypothetical protein n=1 Tax=Kribbella sp. NPDC056345 TaxID=3345789 RepID=UPI0035E2AE7F
MSVSTATPGGPPPRPDQLVLATTALTYAVLAVFTFTGHEVAAGLVIATWRIAAYILRHHGPGPE